MKTIIVGAGFAGLSTALQLKKLINNEITIIDKNKLFVFTPAMAALTTKKIDKSEMTLDLLQVCKKNHMNFVQGTVNKIDPQIKKVYIGKRKITYDYLILSLGSQTNDYKIQGVKKYSITFKKLTDVKKLKEKISNLNDKNKFSIIIVGGGINGVQLSYHLKDYFNEKYPKRDIKITLIESGERVLKELPQKISEKVEHLLLKKKISIFLNSKVTKIKSNTVYATQKHTADIILWTAGIKIPDLAKNFGLNYSSTGLKVNKYFQTTNPYIYALGDCASTNFPKRAQTAIQQGKIVAQNIINDIKNKSKIIYKNKEIPTIISLNNESILHYKKVIIQGKYINKLDQLIRKRFLWSIK